MTRVEQILGHESASEWEKKLAAVRIDTLELSQWDAQKTRLRKSSSQGEEVVIALDRDVFLRDGHVLACDDIRAVICRISLCEVMVVQLAPGADTATLMERCVRLGHALGNQHWPAVVSNGRIYVPLSVDRRVMNSVMHTHSFDGISYEFRPGAEVLAELSPAEARRLFGGAEQPAEAGRHHHHEHTASHDHEHAASCCCHGSSPTPHQHDCCHHGG